MTCQLLWGPATLCVLSWEKLTLPWWVVRVSQTDSEPRSCSSRRAEWLRTGVGPGDSATRGREVGRGTRFQWVQLSLSM